MSLLPAHCPVRGYNSACFLAADPAVANGMAWSELLDALFINNYETDPTLSWQYFGSASGFLRRYPGTIPLNL